MDDFSWSTYLITLSTIGFPVLVILIAWLWLGHKRPSDEPDKLPENERNKD